MRCIILYFLAFSNPPIGEFQSNLIKLSLVRPIGISLRLCLAKTTSLEAQEDKLNP